MQTRISCPKEDESVSTPMSVFFCSAEGAIPVEVLALGLGLGHGAAAADDFVADARHLVHLLRRLLGGAEATRALLVHLGSRRHAVDGHVEHAPRPHDREDPVDELKDGHHHFVLVLWCRPEPNMSH